MIPMAGNYKVMKNWLLTLRVSQKNHPDTERMEWMARSYIQWPDLNRPAT